MQLHDLKRNTKRMTKKRVGRGGKRGKTSGKGHKGQKARAGAKLRPEIRDMIKKLPKQRGRGTHSLTSIQNKPATVTITSLDKAFASGDVITPTLILEKNLIHRQKGRVPQVKVLSTGETTKKFTFVNISLTKGATEKLTKAGSVIK